jgi:ATP synthase protein I|tara:strand:- start:850 stop:1236 length:387 start_codon:yes stop_codon:yes gene_type:complete
VTNLKPPPVYKVIAAQFAASVLIATVSLLLLGFVTAYSALIGGIISTLSNSFFASQAFRYSGARNAKKIVQSFMAGEIGKLIIVIGLFALSFGLITNLNAYGLILSFIVVQFVGVIGSVRLNYKPTTK